jgi:integrase/recombinase XerD
MTESPSGHQLPLFGGSATTRQPAPVAPLPPLAADASLAAAAAAFDQHLARSGKTDNTRRAFASDLRLLARWLGPNREIADIRQGDLRRFLTWLLEGRGKPCSAKSYARRVTTLKVFFGWLAEDRVLPDDPAAGLVHRRAEPPLPTVLSDAEVEALLGATAARTAQGDPRPELLVRLLLATGLKKGELARLAPADIAQDRRPPSLLVRYDSPRWRNKERRVSFDPTLLPLLARYRERYTAERRLFDCTPRNLEYILADLADAAGLPDGTSFETLRWTAALRDHRAGMAPDALRAKLGLSPVTWADTERKLSLLAAGD